MTPLLRYPVHHQRTVSRHAADSDETRPRGGFVIDWGPTLDWNGWQGLEWNRWRVSTGITGWVWVGMGGGIGLEYAARDAGAGCAAPWRPARATAWRFVSE